MLYHGGISGNSSPNPQHADVINKQTKTPNVPNRCPFCDRDFLANPDADDHRLRTGLLLLLLPQREQTDTGNLDDLETNTGDITLCLALATESSEQDLVVLVNEVQATVVGDYPDVSTFRPSHTPSIKWFPRIHRQRTESGDLLAVLDQLDTDTLPDSGVGLLGLNTDLLEHDSLGVGRAAEGRGLEGCAERPLLICQIGPSLLPPVVAELAGGVQTTRLSFTHDCCERPVLAWLVSAGDRRSMYGSNGFCGISKMMRSEYRRGSSVGGMTVHTDLRIDRGDGWLSRG